MGFVSFTSRVKVVVDSLVVGMNVEKNPPARGWQGSAKEDWVTEWFCWDMLVAHSG